MTYKNGPSQRLRNRSLFVEYVQSPSNHGVISNHH